MKVTITPSTPYGTVAAPPSKSMVHRYLICAGLAQCTETSGSSAPSAENSLPHTAAAASFSGNFAKSTIRGIELSEDVQATIDCLRALGAEVTVYRSYESSVSGSNERSSISGAEVTVYRSYEGSVSGSNGRSSISGADQYTDNVDIPIPGACQRTGLVDLSISGADPRLARPAVLNCRESGSTLRFFVPVCALSGQQMTLTGSERLMQRPLSVYEDIFAEGSVTITHKCTSGEDTSSSIGVSGQLSPGEYIMDGNVSSQFISGMLFALPLLDHSSVLKLKPPVESRPYIDMTIASLAAYGVRVSWQDDRTIIIPGGQHYMPQTLTVPGDWSNAAFFLAMGVDVTGLDRSSLQGDKIIEAYLRRLRVSASEPNSQALPVLDIADCPDNESSIQALPVLDIADCPDLGPLLMAFAALNHGCILTGTARLRIKESDRGAAMKEELAKFGVSVTIDDNSITVGAGARAPSEILNGHNDHRIVMALTVMCLHTGGTIEGAEAVNKSFPAFFSTLASLGAAIELAP